MVEKMALVAKLVVVVLVVVDNNLRMKKLAMIG